MRKPCLICNKVFDAPKRTLTCSRECARQYRAGMPAALRHAARQKRIEELRAGRLSFREIAERFGVTLLAVYRSYRGGRAR